MKTFLIVVILGLIAAAACWTVYEQDRRSAPARLAGKIAGDTREVVTNAKAAVKDKVEDWKLTPAAIKEELAKTGRVVRTNAKAVGEHIDDARVVALIKGRLMVEKDISTLAIGVTCDGGSVVLTGTVDSEEAIARAVQIALQTGGVHHVVSRLAVKA